jgi:hypothetical protein
MYEEVGAQDAVLFSSPHLKLFDLFLDCLGKNKTQKGTTDQPKF